MNRLRLTTDKTRLLDASGREVTLRGVNAGGQSKLPPFLPFDDPAQAGRYLDRLVDWGLNVVRLPLTWEAVEPERGRYDEAFLARYEALARGCGQRGLRVIVDFHQDVFARPYAGDGFPLWACPQPAPPPSGPEHAWFMGYIVNPVVKGAFDRFWANDDGLMDAFEDFWRLLARRLWPVEGVIGFEVINEPGWGSGDPVAWARDVLTPFYSRMVRVVQEVAPEALVFIDTTGPDAVVGATSLERPEGEGLVFAPHYYDPPALLQKVWTGEGDIDGPLSRWAALGAAWGVPVLIGELGISPSAEGAADYVRANFEALDRHRLHGTLWEYSESSRDWNGEDMSVVDASGQERCTVAALVRPYPAAIAGRLTAFSWDAAAGEGRLRYEADGEGVSELVVPRRLAPAGVVVEGAEARWDPEAQRVWLRGEGALDVRFHTAPA